MPYCCVGLNTAFLWCSYIGIFVLLVGFWRISHFLDRASWYTCLIKSLSSKYITLHRPENATLPIHIQYAILCEASAYTQTFCLGSHHTRKYLSSHAETCVLGEIVWLVSCADRHCLKVGWSLWVVQERMDKGNHQHHCLESSSFIRSVAHAGVPLSMYQLLIWLTIIVMHCAVQRDTGNVIVQVLVVPSFVLSALHSIHTVTVANRIRDY
jgi:hypothetical protein